MRSPSNMYGNKSEYDRLESKQSTTAKSNNTNIACNLDEIGDLNDNDDYESDVSL